MLFQKKRNLAQPTKDTSLPLQPNHSDSHILALDTLAQAALDS